MQDGRFFKTERIHTGMSRFCPLFSGSSGNCTYIGSSGGGILVDVGVSAKRIETALCVRSIDPRSISAIFVTHEHCDHIAGLRVLIKRYGYKVYGSIGTVEALLDDGVITCLDRFEIMDMPSVEESGMSVRAFATSHDSRQSTGYRVSMPDGRTIAVATDTGCVNEEIRAAMSGCDLVLIESNYDTDMLRNGSYPYYLQRRISAKTGHLSNVCCAAELPGLAQSGVTRFFLGHLSKENNIPRLAFDTAFKSLTDAGLRYNKDFILNVAPRGDEAPVMVL